MECSSSSSYLASPDFLRSVCHVISVVEIPFHVLGAYCIIAKTPAKMRNVKMSMLSLQIVTIIFGLCMNFLLIPFVLFPTMSGTPLGLLTQLNVSPAFQVYMGITSIAITAVGIIAVFENRYHCLFANARWKKLRRYFLVFNYFVASTFFSYQFLTVPDQDYGRQVILAEIPCVAEIAHFELNSIFVFSISNTAPRCLLTAVLTLFISQWIIFVVIIFRNLMAKFSSLSKATIEMQKRFLIAITGQFLISLLLYGFPLYLLFYSVNTKHVNQVNNNLCMITVTLFGLISTITMITFHQPYREWVFGRKRKMEPKIFRTPWKQVPISVADS